MYRGVAPRLKGNDPLSNRLVVEWTRSSVRVAQASGRGRRQRLGPVAVHALDGGDVAATLRALVKPLKVRNPFVISVVPREQVITRVVKFPSADRAELAQMVELYAKAQLPYPREQTVLDHHILVQDAGFTTVAIVACQRELIERQVSLLREAWLPPSFLTVSSWGVLEWYRHWLAALGMPPNPAQEPVLVVNVDETRTDLVLIGEDRILSSRSIGQGLRDWEQEGDTTELLLLELERSRAAIRKELPGVEIRSLLVTGLGAITQWSQQLAQRLTLPARAVALRGAPRAGETLVSPIVVEGLAVAELEALLNLSPPQVRAHVQHRQQVRELVEVGGLLVAVVALGATLLGIQVGRQQQVMRQLDRAVIEAAPDAKRVQEKGRSTQLVHSVLAERRRLATTLAGIFRVSASQVTLEGLVVERAKREIVVRGHAVSTQAVLDYLNALEQLEGVRGVELKYSTRRATSAGDRTDFELVVRQPAVPA